MSIFGRLNSDNNVMILDSEDGEPITRLPDSMPLVWPIDSRLSARHEHANGLVLSVSDTKMLGIEIE